MSATPFDVDRLTAWLRANIVGIEGAVTIERFAVGQSNPTFAILVDGHPRFVVRKKPPGELLPSAHAVDREYRVMSALASAESGAGTVPVPRCHILCTDESVIGTIFFVMDHVAGRSFHDPLLPGLAADARAAIYADIARSIAAIHAVDLDRAGLADFGRPGAYYARQIARWTRQYRATETEPIAAMEQLIAWLPAHIPAGEQVALVHGDYRIDNLIVDPDRRRVAAVLDWELSTIGHPLADLAYHLMGWRLPRETFNGLADTDLAPLGIPDEAAHIAAYLRHAGRDPIDPAEWEYAMAYSMFRVACIRQGVLKRALAGNASNPSALTAGRRARAMAETAWHQVETRIIE
jgi:aminoglycoside phosphotransferase (APT) family kinase protein